MRFAPGQKQRIRRRVGVLTAGEKGVCEGVVTGSTDKKFLTMNIASYRRTGNG
jgi:hypothetical protein